MLADMLLRMDGVGEAMGYTLAVSPDTEVISDNNTLLSCMCDFQSATSSL